MAPHRTFMQSNSVRECAKPFSRKLTETCALFLEHFILGSLAVQIEINISMFVLVKECVNLVYKFADRYIQS